jgi:hypothetical protein
MTTFLSITRSESGAINLSVDTSLFGPVTENTQITQPVTPARTAAKAASKPVAPAKSRSTTAKAAKVPAASKREATKVARASKGSKTAGETAYQSIRRLCQAGEYDQARAIARDQNWPHVILSIGRHEAKRAERANEQATPTAAKAATKAPAKARKAPAKRTTAKAPAKAATPTKAIAPTRRAAKAASKAAKKPSVNRSQAFPANCTSEADLVLWWAQAMAQGSVDVVQAAKRATAADFTKAVAGGDKGQVNTLMKRLRNLDNLLSQA